MKRELVLSDEWIPALHTSRRLCAEILCWIRRRCRSNVPSAIQSLRAMRFLVRPAAIKAATSLSRLVSRTSPNGLSFAHSGRPAELSIPTTPVEREGGRTVAPRATDRIVARNSSADVPFCMNPETPAFTNWATLTDEVLRGSLPFVGFRGRRFLSLFAKRLFLLRLRRGTARWNSEAN